MMAPTQDRTRKARMVARRLADAVRQVAPSGLGHWGPAWKLVDPPSRAFLDALDAWEASTDPDAEGQLRAEVDRTAGGVLAAWREAARRWEAAGRPVVERRRWPDRAPHNSEDTAAMEAAHG